MIAFNKYYNHFNILSILLITVSLLLLIFKGLNYGIDFKGGTLIELRSSDSKINVSSLRDKFNQIISIISKFFNWNVSKIHLTKPISQWTYIYFWVWCS